MGEAEYTDCGHHPDEPCRPWCPRIIEIVRLRNALGAEVAIPVENEATARVIHAHRARGR